MARRRKPETKLADAWKAIWNTPEGRIAIGELMLSSGVYSPIASNDPISMAIANGERNVCCRIARLIGLKDQEFVVHASDNVDLVDRIIQAHS